MKSPDYDLLRREFEAEEGSFLLRLRCDLSWDKAAFSRLVAAMEDCCKAEEGRGTLDRWVAEGFWYLSWFVKDWSTHPNFPRVEAPDYYEKAYSRLFDLSYWFFFGESPYLPGHGFEPM